MLDRQSFVGGGRRSEVANLALSLNTLRQIEFYDGQNVTEKGSALIAAVTFNVVFDF